MVRDRQLSRPIWPLVLIVFATVFVYRNSLSGQFVWDDDMQILRNPAIRSLAAIPRAFTSSFWAFTGTTSGIQSNFYRPVQTVAYAAGFFFSGTKPAGYHAISIAFHVAASLLLYGVALRLGLPIGAAALTGMLFAVHPVHVEAVSWAAGLPDVAAGAFYFAAIWTGLKYFDVSAERWIWASAGLFLAALFSKEMAVTLPAVLLLAIFATGRRRPDQWRLALLECKPLAAAAIAYGVLRVWALGFVATSNLPVELSPLDWFTLAGDVVVRYLRYSLVPYPLAAFHMIPVSLPARIGPAAAAAAVVLMAVVVAWGLRRRFPELPVLLAAFVVMLVPVLYFPGLSQLFAERYLYIPSAAIVLLIGFLAHRFPAVLWTGAAAAVVFAGMTVVRIGVWNNGEALYTSMLAAYPQVPLANSSLAEIHLRRGELDAARRLLETGLEHARSGVYVKLPYEEYRANIGLAAVALRQQRWEDAKKHADEAARIFPAGEWAPMYLGAILVDRDRDYPGAIELFRKAVQLAPTNEVARDYLGSALFNVKRYDDAERQFLDALRINPEFADARLHLEAARRAQATQRRLSLSPK